MFIILAPGAKLRLMAGRGPKPKPRQKQETNFKVTWKRFFCKLLIFIRDLRTRKYLANADPLARPTSACCQNNLFALFFEMEVCVGCWKIRQLFSSPNTRSYEKLVKDHISTFVRFLMNRSRYHSRMFRCFIFCYFD